MGMFFSPRYRRDMSTFVSRREGDQRGGEGERERGPV